MNKEHSISVVAEIDPELHQSLSKYLDSHPYQGYFILNGNVVMVSLIKREE